MNMKREMLTGFSKLQPSEKIDRIASLLDDSEQAKVELSSFFYANEGLKADFVGFSENTISSYHLPYGIVPNVVIDGEVYHVPMVTEESSVVAAAAASAKFWAANGGFKTYSVSAVKVGQIHFSTAMKRDRLITLIAENQQRLRSSIAGYTARMEQRGGGISSFTIRSTSGMLHQYQLLVEFSTADSMGANFINTCLEELSLPLQALIEDAGFECDVLMCILSNYTPDCTVRVGVEAPVAAFSGLVGWMDASTFAHRFKMAVDVAHADMYRATTHNKGIMNGVDGVVLATGNDFRAVEAASHAFASRSGNYRSLSTCMLEEDNFRFELELPLALGVVGGLTSLHPLAKRSLQLLGNPSAQELMAVAAAVGLASNFAAVKSLVTGGIQQGHMKMHLHNILKSYNATKEDKERATAWFATRKVSNVAVKKFLDGERE